MIYKISFQQIDYFLTVAEVLNFTDAARLLYISQPALSKQISILEKELGLSLFIRDRRHVSLTPEGASLYRDWSELTKQMDASVYHAKQLGDKVSGKLSIGCSDTFDYSDILPCMVRNFCKAYPNVTIEIESHSFKTLREQLSDGALDLILTPAFELDGIPDVNWMKLKEIPLALIIPTSNPLCDKEFVSFRDLKNETFVLISPTDSVEGTERTRALCRRFGFHIKNVRYVPNVGSMALAVKNGLGICVCNPTLFESDTSNCKIFPLDVPLDDSYLTAVWKRNHKNLSLDLFTSQLQKHFNQPIR